MGDSITEGTLVAFEKKVGDFVSIDDVIAVIETDKVAVEVRADKVRPIEPSEPSATARDADGGRVGPCDGTRAGGHDYGAARRPRRKRRGARPPRRRGCAPLTKEPQVGALLATLESGGAAAASAAAPATAAPVTAAAPAAPPAHDAVPARTPSIKFVGKRSLLAAAAPVPTPAAAAALPASAPPTKQQPKTLAPTTAADDADFLKYGAFYGESLAPRTPHSAANTRRAGRPRLSAAEIAAVDSGGATLGL
jgi:pyruvate/2-oxoglutarate dehydrogenase complex dihydrolipoamide acyltransferase (E2) component